MSKINLADRDADLLRWKNEDAPHTIEAFDFAGSRLFRFVWREEPGKEYRVIVSVQGVDAELGQALTFQGEHFQEIERSVPAEYQDKAIWFLQLMVAGENSPQARHLREAIIPLLRGLEQADG